MTCKHSSKNPKVIKTNSRNRRVGQPHLSKLPTAKEQLWVGWENGIQSSASQFYAELVRNGTREKSAYRIKKSCSRSYFEDCNNVKKRKPSFSWKFVFFALSAER
jgi:hypothetical protein